MATTTDINSVREALDSVWENPSARNERFGNALKSVSIRNVRGLSVAVELQWPVVALGGINGCGKTTILQICSAAYTHATSGKRHFTLGRWIGPALLGESPPISPAAEISYTFWDPTPGLRVPYQVERKRWGYPRRGNPERQVFFVGIANFAPRIERLDRTHQNRARLTISGTEKVYPRVVESISRILGNSYAEASLHTVSVPNASWEDEIPELVRSGYRYTEAHMGAGEQKVIRLVQYLEGLPEKSTVLLEEPELTLHPDAQFGLAWYLMALARRRGHQLVIATHSPHIFEALPKQARVLLNRDTAGVDVIHGVSKLSAARVLSTSVRSNKDLVFVEDNVARRFLLEIFRRLSTNLLRNASVVAVGSSDDVRRIVARLREQGVRAVGVRDPDQSEDARQGLFSLPGDVSPEELLLAPGNIQRAEGLLAGISSAAERAKVRGLAYSGSEAAKREFKGLCEELQMSDDLVADRLVLAWLSMQDWSDRAKALTEAVERALVDAA